MSTATTHIKKDKVLVPALRFKEFDGEFTLSKLGDELNLFNGYAFSSKDSTENGVRWVKIADVGINEMKLDAPSFLPSAFKEKHSKFLLNKGDYVVALTRPILGGKLKIARINNDFDGSLLNQRVGKLESKNDLEYMYCMLQQKSLISRIENRIAGTDPPNLSPNEIATLKTYIPSLPEQQKIASFLSAVDEKIQQLTKKKELLEQYKKGVMQQLFSGQLRFKDENGNPYPDWEEVGLGKHIDLFSGYAFKGEDISEDNKGIPLLRGINITEGRIRHTKEIDRYFLGTDLKNFDKLKVKVGDLVLGMDGSKVGKNSALITEIDEGALLVQRVARIRSLETASIDFIYQHIRSSQFIRYVDVVNTSSGIPHISSKQIKDFKIKFPCLEEQQKIATYLSSIDTKIESVNNQITQTQTFKKGLLQQMFVAA